MQFNSKQLEALQRPAPPTLIGNFVVTVGDDTSVVPLGAFTHYHDAVWFMDKLRQEYPHAAIRIEERGGSI